MKKHRFIIRMLVIPILVFLVVNSIGCQDNGPGDFSADVIVYGGTSAAVIAAVEVVESGKSVTVVSPDIHLGGLSAGGLGWTDTGRKEVIGGLSRDFYHRIYNHYQMGLLYFVSNDPRVPDNIRIEMQNWGLAKDEFTDNDNWPHQLYILEARRMTGEFVMTENELMKRSPTPESVGMGSYGIDSHNVQRYVTEEGHVHNEGDIGVGLKAPYEIAYGSLVPKKEECRNLLVPVCVSSSHIAFGSIRMEPVFMILGQSSAVAASIAIDDNIAVQEVTYDLLSTKLLKKGQILNN